MTRQQVIFEKGSYTEYTSIKTGKVSVFKYMWAIKPYCAGDNCLTIGVDISPINHENYYAGDELLLEEFPDLEKALMKLRVKYDGMFAIQSTSFTTLYVRVSSTDMLFDVINNFSSVLRVQGVCPEPVIGWSFAFPSVEYGNDMLNHVLHTSGFSIYDMERHMISCSKLGGVKHYDDEVLPDGLPLESDVKFDPEKCRDITQFVQDLINNKKELLSKNEFEKLDKEFLDAPPPIDENKLIMMNMWV